jgi:hypothetical protein
MALLLSRSTLAKGKDMNLWCNFPIPLDSELLKERAEVSRVIIERALQLCAQARQQVRDGDDRVVISFDGSWSQRRNARSCFVAVMCHDTGKILAYECNPGILYASDGIGSEG